MSATVGAAFAAPTIVQVLIFAAETGSALDQIDRIAAAILELCRDDEPTIGSLMNM
jgi:hypothetical protein